MEALFPTFLSNAARAQQPTRSGHYCPRHCATCHDEDAKDGSDETELLTIDGPYPTTLTERNDRQFPMLRLI